MGEKVCQNSHSQSIHRIIQDAKIKRLEQGSTSSQPLPPSRPATVRRTGINHPLAMPNKSSTPLRPPLPPSITINQPTKPNPR